MILRHVDCIQQSETVPTMILKSVQKSVCIVRVVSHEQSLLDPFVSVRNQRHVVLPAYPSLFVENAALTVLDS